MMVWYPWAVMLLLPFVNPILVAILVLLWLPLAALKESMLDSAYFKNLLR